MGLTTKPLQVLLSITMLVALMAKHAAAQETHHLYWTVENKNVSRACSTVSIPTINGQFPGPTVEVDEGDTVVIQVTSRIQHNVTIHWHGIFQHLTNWADGPGHITQCPLQYGNSYTYEFTVANQSGTFWWHAHINWMRATLYGAIIVHPKQDPPYSKVADDFTILFGEWLSEDPDVAEKDYEQTLKPIITATASATINGYTGPLYNCSKSTPVFTVKKGSTYLLRLVNAALQNSYSFKASNHSFTVVGADGSYLKSFSTDLVFIGPGQTTNVLMTANQSVGNYYFGINVASVPLANGDYPLEAALAILKYKGSNSSASPIKPEFPNITDTTPENTYIQKLKNYYNYALPQTMNQNLVYVTGTATVLCKASENCTTELTGTVQNATFDDPQNTTILEAYYYNQSGVYTTDIPDQPSVYIDFQALNETPYSLGVRGRRVKPLNYNDTVQLVLQNVVAAGESDHPFHLHGHDFYVVGRQFGNYNSSADPQKFNLVDPPKFNTYTIPNGGWIAIRFLASNPGVWLLHCHFERHKTWGMETVFITGNGVGASQTLPGPLHPLPNCTQHQ